jgi:pre-rRNA-processing protein TSR2
LLLQIMEDEFELAVEDGSEAQVARSVLSVREECGRGEYGTVDAMYEKWKGKKGNQQAPKIARMGPQSDDEESVDDEDWDDEEDVEMTDAPPSRLPKEKPAPEVDDDGFTKVVGKKRR